VKNLLIIFYKLTINLQRPSGVLIGQNNDSTGENMQFISGKRSKLEK
jgi:hypothetical protein